jgi:hypothetical protein
MHPVDVATNLLEAFNAGDLDRMRELLAPDLIAWVTNVDGEADCVTGREEYLARIAAMDLPAAQYRVTLTQSPAAIDDHLLCSWSRSRRSGTVGGCKTSLPMCYAWTTVESRNGGWPTPSRPKVISSGLDEV